MALTSVEREPGELRSASTGLRCILLLVLVVTLMVLDHRNQHLVEVRKDLAAMLHPVQLLVSAPANISRQLSESIASRNNLIDENRRLRQEELALKARMLRMTALESENARLRALLESPGLRHEPHPAASGGRTRGSKPIHLRWMAQPRG